MGSKIDEPFDFRGGTQEKKTDPMIIKKNLDRQYITGKD